MNHKKALCLMEQNMKIKSLTFKIRDTCLICSKLTDFYVLNVYFGSRLAKYDPYLHFQ